ARLQVFDEPGDEILTPAMLRQAGARLPVRLIRAHRILTFEYAIDEIRRSGDTPAERITNLLVWRRDRVGSHRRIDSPGRTVGLWHAVRGTTLGALCEQVAKHDDHPAETAFHLLASWTADGLVTNFCVLS